MFYVKIASPAHEYTPSYIVLDIETAQDALAHFRSTYQETHMTPKFIVSLCEAEDMDHEYEMLKINVDTIAPRRSEEFLWSHPLNKTVHHEEVPELLIEELRPHLKFRHFSSPNGSSYDEQYLPNTIVTLPSFGRVDITNNKVRVGRWNVYKIPGNYYYGSGTNFGVYFNTCDKYLVAFKVKHDSDGSVVKAYENTSN